MDKTQFNRIYDSYSTKIKNPYEKKNTAALIVEKLTNMPTPQNLKKGFFDVPLSL